ncbi:hypothetical protein Peur_063829 [Populus x canadensis]
MLMSIFPLQYHLVFHFKHQRSFCKEIAMGIFQASMPAPNQGFRILAHRRKGFCTNLFVFGEVAEGLETLTKINEAYVDEKNRPSKISGWFFEMNLLFYYKLKKKGFYFPLLINHYLLK